MKRLTPSSYCGSAFRFSPSGCGHKGVVRFVYIEVLRKMFTYKLRSIVGSLGLRKAMKRKSWTAMKKW